MMSANRRRARATKVRVVNKDARHPTALLAQVDTARTARDWLTLYDLGFARFKPNSQGGGSYWFRQDAYNRLKRAVARRNGASADDE